MENPFSNLEDTKLMELYISGDEMAFEAIYIRHKDRVYSYLSKRLNDQDLINDTFQNIFIKFHKSRTLYKNEYLLIKWIYTICRSELLDAVKKNKHVLVELKEDHTLITPSTDYEEINLELEKTLTANEKKALKLRYYSDEDFFEISKALSTSESNSRKIISRGLKKLKIKYLGEMK